MPYPSPRSSFGERSEGWLFPFLHRDGPVQGFTRGTRVGYRHDQANTLSLQPPTLTFKVHGERCPQGNFATHSPPTPPRLGGAGPPAVDVGR